jgi:hypothetical protein
MRPPLETGGRCALAQGQAGTHTYVADGPASVCEVKSLQWQRLQGLQIATA